MYEIIILLLLASTAYLFYQNENKEKKYEEKINEILSRLNPQIKNILESDQILTKQLAEKRIIDPLLAPEIRGPFPIANAGWAINQNPRILPGQNVNLTDPEFLSYQQMGFLTNNENDKPIILPLYGKKKYPRSDQYEYYYQTDKYNQIKIPIEYKKNYPLSTKDTINIPEYKKEFVVTIYDYDAPKYIPYVV